MKNGVKEVEWLRWGKIRPTVIDPIKKIALK